MTTILQDDHHSKLDVGSPVPVHSKMHLIHVYNSVQKFSSVGQPVSTNL